MVPPWCSSVSPEDRRRQVHGRIARHAAGVANPGIHLIAPWTSRSAVDAVFGGGPVQLVYKECDDLPPLGYCGRITRDGIEVLHGEQVETRPAYFTDGGWAGPFAEGPDASHFMIGTAGADVPGGFRLFSSSTPLDRVFVREPNGTDALFSNSLPLLLSAMDDELDTEFVRYRSTFMSSDLGVRLAPRSVPTRRGQRVRYLLNEVADLSADSLSVSSREPDPPFHDFEHYRGRLRRDTQAVLANVTDPARRHRYEPLTPLSTGYDSSTVAVLAAEAGFRSAVTMLRPDEHDPGAFADHPGRLARALGLELQEVERNLWRGRTDLPDAGFAASGVSLMDISLLALEPVMAGRVVLSGVAGDNVWGKDNFRAYDDIVQGAGAVSGRGLAEHRLQVGYLVFAVPFIGCTAHRSIFRISNSPEMEPWSVGGPYDRPIARRIIEEAGVQRGDFATKKFAGGARVGSTVIAYRGATHEERSAELEESMTSAGAAAFCDFVASTPLDDDSARGRRLRRRLTTGSYGHWLYERIDAVNFRFGRRFHGVGLRTFVPRRVMVWLASRFRPHPDYTYLLPHWGVSVLQQRYGDVRDHFTGASSIRED